MGLLDFLGIDDIAESISEFASDLDELKEEIVTSLVEPGEELKKTVDDISDTLHGADTPKTS